MSSVQIGQHMHNNYLTLMIERGILGLASFLLFFCFIIKRLILVLRKTGGDLFSLSLLCAVVSFLVASFFLDTTHELIIWFIIGMIFSVSPDTSFFKADKNGCNKN